jgi:hypothetical protein
VTVWAGLVAPVAAVKVRLEDESVAVPVPGVGDGVVEELQPATARTRELTRKRAIRVRSRCIPQPN